MFPWKKPKEKDDRSRKKDNKKSEKVLNTGHNDDSRRKRPVISNPIPPKTLTSPILGPGEDEGDSSEHSGQSVTKSPESSPSSGSLSVDTSRPNSPPKKPPPVPPKKPAARTLSAPKTKPPERPAPRSVSLTAAPLQRPTKNSPFVDSSRNSNSLNSPTGLLPGEHLGYSFHWKPNNLKLSLPPISSSKCPAPRILTIVRQQTGDFGFSLRRSALSDSKFGDGAEQKKMLMFAEPSTLGRTNETGLLPGDRLLEVNGVAVDGKTREQIIELIKTSGNSVVLKVQPLPELCEIIARVAEGSYQAGKDTICSRTLSRSGSRRYKMGAKTDEEIAAERVWMQSEKAWILYRGGYAGGSLVKSNGSVAEGKVKVKLDGTGEIVEVDEEDVEKANSPHLDYVEDLSQLRHLNEGSILHSLRHRFSSSLIHTYAGSSLIVFNPLNPLAIYSEKVMKLFKGCRQDDLPPHIFAVAQTAYASLLTTRRDQAIAFQGRSGSGKTSNFRQILQYFAVTAGSPSSVVTAEKLNAIASLLESFGNCRTSMNTNSSRFTELFSFDFDHSGQIVSASVQAYMLERSRVCRRPDGEPNFHIFYYLLAGMNDTLKKELFVDNLEEMNLFLTPIRKAEDKQRASLMWDYILSALQTLGVKEKETKAIWSVLGSIYHLGVAGAVRGVNGRLQFSKPPSAQKAALLLGTSVEDLAKAVFAHELLSSSSNSRMSSRNPAAENQPDPLESLQAFVMALYSEVFNAVVSLINRSLSGTGRHMATLQVLDAPGFQNPAACGRRSGATLEDLCHNYVQERLQLHFYDTTFVAQQERYSQENISLDMEDFQVPSPATLVSLIDYTPAQQSASSTSDLRIIDQRGLFWILDDESLYPGNTEDAFLDKVFLQCNTREKQQMIQRCQQNNQFILHHLHGTNPVSYSTNGWLRFGRENPAYRQAASILQDSQKEHISHLFVSSRGLSSALSGSIATLSSESGSTLRRGSSMRRAQSVAAAGVKRRSLPLQVKYTMDGLIDILRRTKVHFIHCFVSHHSAGLCDLKASRNSPEEMPFNVPLVRSQLRGAQVLDAVRIRKQGFPENVMYVEFKRRYELLASPEYRAMKVFNDEKHAVELLLEHLDTDSSSYRLGLSQIFMRAGTLSQLESQRDEKLSDVVVQFQAHCRGYIGRKKFKQLKVQDVAIRCIQRNVRTFLAIRSWPWWRLFIKLTPLLNIHRTEEELRAKTEEVETLKVKIDKLEKERTEMKHNYDKLEAKVAELWSDLSQEQAAAGHASEMLDSESSERMRLEKEVRDLQTRCAQTQKERDRMEMEVMESRMIRSTELNGDLSDDEDINAVSVYRQKYEHAMRELELTKRKLKQQHEDELEQQILVKKATEKKLAEALDDMEEARQNVNQWKRKAQKLASELQDLKLVVEEHMSRNAELEKKQRRFDSDLNQAIEALKQEKFQKERIVKEKELLYAEKHSLDQELQSTRLEMELQQEKINNLHRELDELTFNSHAEEEVAKLKRAKQELERKSRDQEEELEDLAAQVQLLEQAKLRLEMALEKQRQEHKKELSVKEEEIEETRASASKKLKNMEALLESELEERHILSKQRNELERRLGELSERPPPRDPEIERRLRRDLKRTKALLQDAQTMIEHMKDGQANRSIVRQLKNQLEDAEFAKTVAVKARQGAEMELQEVQSQLEEVLRTKNESEGRCLQLSREKSALQTQLEELEEEQAEIMKKYKAAVQQTTNDQKLISEQSQQLLELETEKHQLKEQVQDMYSKMEHMSNQPVDSHALRRLESKVRDLESKLELELTAKTRLESQIGRLKEQCSRLQEECDQMTNKEHQMQENCRRLQRQLRELREDFSAAQQKEAESQQKCHELEIALENSEADLQQTKNDLKLACQRIQNLQNALEEDLDSGTDVAEDSESESDNDLDVDSMLRRHGLSPIPRKYSMSSDRSGLESPVLSRHSSRNSLLCSSIPVSRPNEGSVTGLSTVSPESEIAQSSNSQQHYVDEQLVDV